MFRFLGCDMGVPHSLRTSGPAGRVTRVDGSITWGRGLGCNSQLEK